MTFPEKYCALIEQPKAFLDHTAPLCALTGIPLITSNPYIKLRYASFYPGLRCQLKNWHLLYLMENYDTVIYPFSIDPPFRTMIAKSREKEPRNPIWQKPTRFIYHPHGCSDKGYQGNPLNPYNHLAGIYRILLYGKRTEEVFRDNDILHLADSYAFVGNYRRAYYERHRDFFDEKIRKEVLSLFAYPEQKTILYAPTWTDKEDSSSFFKCHKEVIDRLPDEYNLILKTHALLHQPYPGYDPEKMQLITQKYRGKKNILLLADYPLVYPLIQACDLYIGDYSSIGYDVLAFDKPMFFLNHLERRADEKSARLLRCGRVIFPNEFGDLYKIIAKELPDDQKYSSLRKEAYADAFGEVLSPDKATEKLLKALQ